MTKRKLNRRQSRRIEQQQEQQRRRADAQDWSGGEPGDLQEGLVTAHFGAQVEVEDRNQVRRRCHLRANLGSVVTGDLVTWHEGVPTGVVVARSPRHSELLRSDPSGKLKPVASNIDQIIVVIAPVPEPQPHLLDRYLVAAEAVSITPLILLHKSDLLNKDTRRALDELLAPYPGLGYPVLEASCRQARGLLELKAVLTGRTSIFAGQSGVGKSSLVNTLLPEANAMVGKVSALGGVHTTTTAKLFHLDAGGSLIDSPGVREFGLWHMQRRQVQQGFREFRLLNECKFRDCRHQQEPGCAVIEAVASGAISARRLASFHNIISSGG